MSGRDVEPVVAVEAVAPVPRGIADGLELDVGGLREERRPGVDRRPAGDAPPEPAHPQREFARAGRGPRVGLRERPGVAGRAVPGREHDAASWCGGRPVLTVERPGRGALATATPPSEPDVLAGRGVPDPETSTTISTGHGERRRGRGGRPGRGARRSGRPARVSRASALAWSRPSTAISLSRSCSPNRIVTCPGATPSRSATRAIRTGLASAPGSGPVTPTCSTPLRQPSSASRRAPGWTRTLSRAGCMARSSPIRGRKLELCRPRAEKDMMRAHPRSLAPVRDLSRRHGGPDRRARADAGRRICVARRGHAAWPRHVRRPLCWPARPSSPACATALWTVPCSRPSWRASRTLTQRVIRGHQVLRLRLRDPQGQVVFSDDGSGRGAADRGRGHRRRPRRDDRPAHAPEHRHQRPRSSRGQHARDLSAPALRHRAGRSGCSRCTCPTRRSRATWPAG